MSSNNNYGRPPPRIDGMVSLKVSAKKNFSSYPYCSVAN